MPTKLSRYCEGVIEAAWLAAVIVVPVFFNVYSSRIFEPDLAAVGPNSLDLPLEPVVLVQNLL